MAGTRGATRVTFNVRRGGARLPGSERGGQIDHDEDVDLLPGALRWDRTGAGLDVFDQSLEVRKRIGYLPEDTPIYRDMTVLEYLQFAAEIRGMGSRASTRIKEIGGRCGLGDVAGKLIGELSKGYRQRVGLAQAMLHDPDIVFLDEPTSGLDPNQIVEIRSLIKEVGREKTVILSTHILPEVQATCSRSSSSAGARSSPTAPRRVARAPSAAAGTGWWWRPTASPPTPSAPAWGASAGSAAVSPSPARTGLFLHHRLRDRRGPAQVAVPAAVDNRWTLLELVRESASLEDVFRSLTHDHRRGEPDMSATLWPSANASSAPTSIPPSPTSW
jgi:ABC-2 type transport system ATP-binding protein